jgi:hypothetical protein
VIGPGALHQIQGRSPQAFRLRQFTCRARRLQLAMKTEQQVTRRYLTHVSLDLNSDFGIVGASFENVRE